MGATDGERLLGATASHDDDGQSDAPAPTPAILYVFVVIAAMGNILFGVENSIVGEPPR